MQAYISRDLKGACLLFVGIVGGTILSTKQAYIVRNLPWFIACLLLLLFIGLGGIEFFASIFSLLWCKVNKARRKIGVLAPYEISKRSSSWVGFSRRRLLDFLTESKVRFSRISVHQEMYEYPVILNPYGGVYPENDLARYESLNAIFKYVEKGGVFVNVADIPFYYAFDKKLNRKVDTTPLAEDYSLDRTFKRSVLTQRLDVHVLDSKASDIKPNRIIALSEVSHNFYPEDFKGHENDARRFSPYLALPYGRGYFVFSTDSLDGSNLDPLKDMVEKAFGLI